MNSQEPDKMALFKYSLISPAVTDTHKERSNAAYFRKAAEQSYRLPDGRIVKYSPNTIKHWYQTYLKGGFDALVQKPRSDIGHSRVLTLEQQIYIDKLRAQFPLIPATAVYQIMIERGLLLRQDASLSTIQRYLRKEAGDKQPVERLAYEMEFANDCWQADTCHLPPIYLEGKKQKTYLICLIDDASRLIPHGEIYAADNAINFQDCLKKAISKYGVPKKLFVDHGSPYKNQQLSLICASLGIVLIHSRVRQPQGKGKIDRMFRTIQQGWVYVNFLKN
jgi:hypothetical protein